MTERPSHRSTRLAGYDYTSPGAYFLTVSTYEGRCIFHAPEFRSVIEDTWRQIPLHFPTPDWTSSLSCRTTYMALWIVAEAEAYAGGIDARPRAGLGGQLEGARTALLAIVGAQYAAPLPPQHAARRLDPRTGVPYVLPGSLGAVVRSFKSAVTKRLNEMRGTPGAPVWQRNYYERVIRNEGELSRVREYIRLNPLKWHLDRENPQRTADAEHDSGWAWLEGPTRRGAACCAPTTPEMDP